MIKLNNQIGDTIIEVLIAIAVASIVLAGAYSITSRSLGGIRSAQEHTEALKYAQNQVESLKQLANGNSGNDYDSPANSIFGLPASMHLFCLDSGLIMNDATNPTQAIRATGAAPVLPTANSGYTTECQQVNGITYNVAIDRKDYVGSTYQHTFIVHVRWDSIHKKGQDEVTLSYNLDK
jgi:type II secretory pathway pseudopilin PulG